MSNSIDFLLVISKIQSPIYCPYPQGEDTLLEVAFPGMLSEFEMIFI